MFRIIKWIILISLVVIQFIPVDRSVPEPATEKDFISAINVPSTISKVLKSACYDCHSYETKYPWYSYVAPVSWFVQHHVDEGREHLNFSVWTDYSPKKAKHKLEECFEEVEEGEMPMTSYTLLHGSASLSPAQVEETVRWFKKMYRKGVEKKQAEQE